MRSLRQIEKLFRQLDAKEGRTNQFYSTRKMAAPSRARRRGERYDADKFWDVLEDERRSPRFDSRVPIFRVRGHGRVKYLTESPRTTQLLAAREAEAVDAADDPCSPVRPDRSVLKKRPPDAPTKNSPVSPPRPSPSRPRVATVAFSKPGGRTSSTFDGSTSTQQGLLYSPDGRAHGRSTRGGLETEATVQGRVLADLYELSRSVESHLNSSLDARSKTLSSMIESAVKRKKSPMKSSRRSNKNDGASDDELDEGMVVEEAESHHPDDVRTLHNTEVAILTPRDRERKKASVDVIDTFERIRRSQMVSPEATPATSPRGIKTYLVSGSVCRLLDEFDESDLLDERSLRHRREYYQFRVRVNFEQLDEYFNRPQAKEITSSRGKTMMSNLLFAVRIVGKREKKVIPGSALAWTASSIFDGSASSAIRSPLSSRLSSRASSTLGPPSSMGEPLSVPSVNRGYRSYTARSLRTSPDGWLRFTRRSPDPTIFSPIDSLQWVKRDWRRLYGSSLVVELYLSMANPKKLKLVERSTVAFGLVL